MGPSSRSVHTANLCVFFFFGFFKSFFHIAFLLYYIQKKSFILGLPPVFETDNDGTQHGNPSNSTSASLREDNINATRGFNSKLLCFSYKIDTQHQVGMGRGVGKPSTFFKLNLNTEKCILNDPPPPPPNNDFDDWQS